MSLPIMTRNIYSKPKTMFWQWFKIQDNLLSFQPYTQYTVKWNSVSQEHKVQHRATIITKNQQQQQQQQQHATYNCKPVKWLCGICSAGI